MTDWNESLPFARRRLPSLQELVSFEVVARRSNFTKAAEELSLTQSAISKQIRQLEQTLGLVLFDRVGGRVRLTSAGEVYLKATKDILARFRTAALSVGGHDPDEPTLNLVVLPTFASHWLMRRIPRFVAAQGEVTINLTTRVQPFDLFGDSYDLAIPYGAAGWTHPDAVMLFEELFVAVASPAYRERVGLGKSSDLRGAVLLQQADRPTLWSEWFAASGIMRANPGRGPVLDRFSMTIAAAQASLGVALVPRFFVEEEIIAGGLVIVADFLLKGTGAYHVVMPRANAQPVAAAFRRWLFQEAGMSARLEKARSPVR